MGQITDVSAGMQMSQDNEKVNMEKARAMPRAVKILAANFGNEPRLAESTMQHANVNDVNSDNH